jgi:hypothetical protein
MYLRCVFSMGSLRQCPTNGSAGSDGGNGAGNPNRRKGLTARYPTQNMTATMAIAVMGDRCARSRTYMAMLQIADKDELDASCRLLKKLPAIKCCSWSAAMSAQRPLTCTISIEYATAYRNRNLSKRVVENSRHAGTLHRNLMHFCSTGSR